LTPDQELAKIVKDRVPGKPVNCINLTQIRSTTIIDRTAIVYDMGGTIYVNRPPYPQSLDDDDILITNLGIAIVQCRYRPTGHAQWRRGHVVARIGGAGRIRTLYQAQARSGGGSGHAACGVKRKALKKGQRGMPRWPFCWSAVRPIIPTQSCRAASRCSHRPHG
jgi:hypothetical protein